MWQDTNNNMQATAERFLNSVLPQCGLYSASMIGRGISWKDRPKGTIPALVQQVFADSAAGHNTYFGLSSYREGWHVNTSTGKKEFRTQSNTVSQRCLWLDIDCGKEPSPYATNRDAVKALHVFLKKTGLPVPHIVDSGHGLHLYWPFKETITTARWVQVASLLRALCVHFDFIADHSRTTDPASVLRVPGTVNYDYKGKYDGVPKTVHLLYETKPVSVLTLAGQLLKVIKDERVQVAALRQTVLPIPSCNVTPVPEGMNFNMSNDAFDMGIKRHPVEILRKCKQIQQAGLGTYTQWYNMMLVMKHCVAGNRTVHAISKMDKVRYNYDNVETKYQQAVDGGYGPCRCTTFNEKDPGICPTCPYWGKIASPLLLGEPYNKQDQAPVKLDAPVVATHGDTAFVPPSTLPSMDVVPFQSKDFTVVPGKGIYWLKRKNITGSGTDEEGETVSIPILISDTELYIHSLCVDNTTGTMQRSYVMRKKAPGRAAEDILFDVSNDLSTQGMQKWLANHGMLPKSPKYNKPMGDFVQTYIAMVQNRLPEIFVRESFGWVTNNDVVTGETYEGFIVADKMFTNRGIADVKLNERASALAKDFAMKGSLDTWKVIPKMYRLLDQPFPALMMCAAFAAPFMRLGSGVATNAAYSLWDIKGGKGKSTVLEACASVWGNPGTMLQTKSDTTSSRFQKFAVYRNLPVFVDEITNLRDAEMSDLIYDIVNGREKSRSTASGTGLARQGQWSTITMFTSNKSLYETLKSFRAQSDATCMRVIETQCDFKDYTGTPWQAYITAVAKAIRKNYGMAGQELMKYCFAHPEVFSEIQAWADEFVAHHSAGSDERFWMHGIAIPLAVARICVRAGLLDYDVDGWLVPYILNQLLPRLRMSVKSNNSTGSNILSDFLSENLDSTLVVQSEKRTPAQVDTGTISGMDTYVKHYPSRSILIRHEEDSNTFYVSHRALSRWCTDNGYSLTMLLQDVQAAGAAVSKLQFSLGRYVNAVDRKRSMVVRFRIPKE